MRKNMDQTDSGGAKPADFSLAQSFKCAFEGIAVVAKQRNFRIELCFAVAALLLAAMFRLPVEQWLIVIVCIGLVLSLECVNTAIEAVVDLASPEWNELAKIAKDGAAGAALLASIASFIVGVVLFAPRILAAVGLL